MLAYFILAHHRPEAVIELLEAIYNEEDAYVISMNGSVPAYFRHNLLWLQKFPNIRLLINRGINWSGVSMLDAILEGMQVIVDNFPQAKYILNISGEDFPVKPRDELVQYLNARDGKNFILANKLTSSKLDTAYDQPLLASSEFSPSEPLPGTVMVNFLESPAQISSRGDLRFIGDPWLYYCLDAPLRVFCFNQDRTATGEILITHPSEFFLQARKHSVQKYARYWQKWCVALTREFTEFLLKSDLSFRIYDHLRNSPMPEEAFFATVICNSEFRDRHISHSFTYDRADKSREIDADDITAIDACDADRPYFFARKFVAKSEAVRQHYQQLIGSNTFSRPRNWEDTCDILAETRSILARTESVEWQFGRLQEKPAATLRFGSDGTVLGATNATERHWRCDAPAYLIEFSSDAGTVTSAFSSFAFSRNGNVYLFGKFLLAENVVHYLESKIEHHLKRATGPVDAIKWLAGLDKIQNMAVVPDDISDADLELQFNAGGYGIGTLNDASECWLTDFGILITSAFDMEFIAIFYGFWESDSGSLTLIGQGRDFRGKSFAVNLKGIVRGA